MQPAVASKIRLRPLSADVQTHISHLLRSGGELITLAAARICFSYFTCTRDRLVGKKWKKLGGPEMKHLIEEPHYVSEEKK